MHFLLLFLLINQLSYNICAFNRTPFVKASYLLSGIKKEKRFNVVYNLVPYFEVYNLFYIGMEGKVEDHCNKIILSAPVSMETILTEFFGFFLSFC